MIIPDQKIRVFISSACGNEPVSLEVMMCLCKVFHCDIGDVMEMIEDED